MASAIGLRKSLLCLGNLLVPAVFENLSLSEKKHNADKTDKAADQR